MAYAWSPSNTPAPRRLHQVNTRTDISCSKHLPIQSSVLHDAYNLHASMSLLSSLPSESETQQDAEETTTKETFTSPVMQVYIEDTDAYAMKYNTNYLRSYERALHGAEVGAESILSKHADDWTIVKVTNQKFRATAALGQTFCITGTLVERSDEYEVWDLQMVCQETNVVLNSATVTVGLPLSFANGEGLVSSDAATPTDESFVASAATVHCDTLHRDEFDPHHPNLLPLRSVLNLCERSRSNYIGGPDALSRMQKEDNVMVVVTSINDLCSFPQAHSYPRQQVRVETRFVPRRRGLLCEAQHCLFDDETDEPIAQAVVTMAALDATTKRPTRWPRFGGAR